MWEIRRDGSNLHRLSIPSRPLHGIHAGCWTPDGNYFFYTEDLGQANGARLWITGGGPGWRSPVHLMGGPLSFHPWAFAVNGSTLFAIGMDSSSELARFDAEQGKFVPFWAGVAAVDVEFSHDGTRAAWRHFPDHTLWASRADGSEARRLTDPPLEAYQPHWSPDDKQIAFMGWTPNQPSRILVIGPEGGIPKAVRPDDPIDQGVPTWSPDGRYIVYGELRQRVPDAGMVIHLLDLKSGAESVLPDSRGKWSPRWSPDGRFVLATATDFGSLYLFDCNTRLWRVLYSGVNVGEASWSRDSRFVQYHAELQEGIALFRVRIADSAVERVTMTPVGDDPWCGIGLDGAPQLLLSRRIEEIYAIDLRLP